MIKLQKQKGDSEMKMIINRKVLEDKMIIDTNDFAKLLEREGKGDLTFTIGENVENVETFYITTKYGEKLTVFLQY